VMKEGKHISQGTTTKQDIVQEILEEVTAEIADAAAEETSRKVKGEIDLENLETQKARITVLQQALKTRQREVDAKVTNVAAKLKEVKKITEEALEIQQHEAVTDIEDESKEVQRLRMTAKFKELTKITELAECTSMGGSYYSLCAATGIHYCCTACTGSQKCPGNDLEHCACT